jgi:hypothetical protein
MACSTIPANAAHPSEAAAPIAGAEGVLGFRLFVLEDAPRELPEAVAVSIPRLDPDP